MWMANIVHIPSLRYLILKNNSQMEVDLSDFPNEYYPDLVVKAQNNNFNCLCFSHEMRRRKSVVECGSDNVVNGAIIRQMEGEDGSLTHCHGLPGSIYENGPFDSRFVKTEFR